MKNIVLCFVTLVSTSHSLYVSEKGGYNDVVVKIEDDLKSQDCKVVLENLQSFIKTTSTALQSTLSGEIFVVKNIFNGST